MCMAWDVLNRMGGKSGMYLFVCVYVGGGGGEGGGVCTSGREMHRVLVQRAFTGRVVGFL